MKVELSKDPLFQKKESPIKEIKDKQRQRQRQLRLMRANPINQKLQSNIEIVDPLPQELHRYKDQMQYKKTFDSSKASHKLKKYIIEQERNLKCMRLERIEENFDVGSSRVRRSEFKLDMENKNQDKQKEKKLNKQIHIPKIQQIFKNQQKQFVLYESRMMRNRLAKAMSLVENGITRIKSYSYAEAPSIADTRKNTTDKFPHIHTLTHSMTGSSYLNEEDYEIDKVIQKKLVLSQKLRERLEKQKKQLTSHQAKEISENKNLNFFLNIPKKQKKKVILEGVKSITFCEGEKTLRITPASSLLFSLNKMSHGRQKKQQQLEGLIRNSYQNRDSILTEKSIFYQQQSPFSNLNTSSQFRLRQLMDKKLMHRLQLSKDQINKFVAYLSEIKEYHIILNETILEILKEVRENLLSGKVMKSSDLNAIIQSKPKSQIEKHPNGLILQKLAEMMI